MVYYFNTLLFSITIAKLYPIHNPFHPFGQFGIFMSWLWMAITFDCVSHTAHLKDKEISPVYIIDFLTTFLYEIYININNALMIPGNIIPDSRIRNWHHGNRFVCWKPIRFVISTCIIANIIKVTEKEWHCVKTLNTRTRRPFKIENSLLEINTFIGRKMDFQIIKQTYTQILMVRFLVSF